MRLTRFLLVGFGLYAAAAAIASAVAYASGTAVDMFYRLRDAVAEPIWDFMRMSHATEVRFEHARLPSPHSCKDDVRLIAAESFTHRLTSRRLMRKFDPGYGPIFGV